MKHWATPGRSLRAVQRAAAGSMLLLWLVLFALTASPQLHHLLHSDSQAPGHQCLITQIQHQPLLAGFAHVSAPAPSQFEVAWVHRVDVRFSSASDFLISPSRAPPVFGLDYSV